MSKAEAIIPATSNGNNFYLLFSIMEYEGLPILFVAIDDFNGLFLCNCVEFRNFQRWVISETNINILDMVVNQQTTVFDALKQGNSLKTIATYDYETGNITQEKIAFENITPEDLPEQNAFACMIKDDTFEKLYLLRMLPSLDNLESNNSMSIVYAKPVLDELNISKLSVIQLENIDSGKTTFFSDNFISSFVA